MDWTMTRKVRAVVLTVLNLAHFIDGAVAQSVERVTPGEEVLGFIPTVATRSLPVGSVAV